MRNFMVVKVMVSDETFTDVILVLIICSRGLVIYCFGTNGWVY